MRSALDVREPDGGGRPTDEPDRKLSGSVLPLKGEAFDRFQHGLLVLDGNGTILCGNSEARRIFALVDTTRGLSTCCEVLCGDQLDTPCLTAHALQGQGEVIDVRRDLDTLQGKQAIWISAFPLGNDPHRVLIQLRCGDVNDRRRRNDPGWKSCRQLRITTLGRTSLTCAGVTIGGHWLDRRSGQLLRYLVVKRARSVTADEIGEDLWRDADYSIARNVRTCVHRLRSELEPERLKHQTAEYVLTCGASYRLNLEKVQIDADEFEALAGSGLRCAASAPTRALRELESALALYGGEFLADAPFAEWALSERARLHDLACDALRAVAEIHRHAGRGAGVVGALERLATLQPLDEVVGRELIELDLSQGRGSDAKRRFDALTRLMVQQLGCAPTFTLAQLRTPRA